MKKLEKLIKKAQQIKSIILINSIEKKDTSYRRNGGYFGTAPADTSGLIIFDTIARTKHLNTYICVSQDMKEKVDEYKNTLVAIDNERARLKRIEDKKAPEKAREFMLYQIKMGWHLTNYKKILIEGKTNIYFAHPHYQHSDYNKSIAMPNTPKNRKIAKELNELMQTN